MAGAEGAPRVLILGGCGVIGRNLVLYLVQNRLVSSIRIADKRFPQMVFPSPEHRAALLNKDVVEFVQADLSDDDHVGRAFDPDKGEFDIVFNCCAETKHGQTEERYQKMTVDSTAKCAAVARGYGVKKFVHVSSAFVYEGSSRKPSKEDGKLKPWTTQATYCLRAEEALRAVEGLDYVIVRPAVVYGPGDEMGIMPRCVIAVAYRHDAAKMQFMWNAALKVATVHVFDVCRALWLAAARGPAGSVYNLADEGHTDQGRVAGIISELFGVETGFVGRVGSNIASGMQGIVDDANQGHMAGWLASLKENGIKRTSLSPFLHPELLSMSHLHVDGSKITEDLGFQYKVKECSAAAVRDMVQRAVAQGIFPATVKGENLGLGDGPAAGGAAAAGGGGGR